ncbi:hypothetical protein K474DRAFT_450340 [Panus rudis PR-1116 ss-1]|nr:hypothetical protein K474DRAFT_450340 [Panus rudis PR-1116 ss-1]
MAMASTQAGIPLHWWTTLTSSLTMTICIIGGWSFTHCTRTSSLRSFCFSDATYKDAHVGTNDWPMTRRLRPRLRILQSGVARVVFAECSELYVVSYKAYFRHKHGITS